VSCPSYATSGGESAGPFTSPPPTDRQMPKHDGFGSPEPVAHSVWADAIEAFKGSAMQRFSNYMDHIIATSVLASTGKDKGNAARGSQAGSVASHLMAAVMLL